MAFRFSDQSAALRRAADLYERTSFDLAVRQLRAQVLLQELNAPTLEEVAFRIDRVGLRAAAYLLRSAALSLDARDDQAHALRNRYMRRAAEIFERLALRSASERGRFEALSQAAACWSLAGYEANAVVLGRRIREAFQSVGQGGPGEADYYALTSAILERDVRRVERFAGEREGILAGFEDWAIARSNSRQDETAAHLAIAEVVLLGELWAAVPDVLRFWQAGDNHRAQSALRRLRDVERALSDLGLPDLWLVVESARLVFEDSVRNSTWHQLRRHVDTWSPIWTRYASRLARQVPSVVELWPSQRRALEAGALDPKRSTLVIRTPTSSGKTRVAEMAILAALNRERGAGAVYLVPYRSLATEVEASLGASLGQLGYQVSSLFGGYETSELEDFLLLQSDVLIVTPEKLDLVIRQSPDFLQRLRVVVVDEGHLLGEGPRGLRLELLVTRLRLRAPETKVLFLSAVLPNADEIARWLDPAGGNLVDETWKPTDVVTGTFTWSGLRGRVDYVGHTEFFVPYLIERRFESLGVTPKTGVPRKPQAYPVEISQTAAELALHYAQLGPVIVYAATKRNAAAVADRLAVAIALRRRSGDFNLVDESNRPRLTDLQQLATELLGADHELIDYIGDGFAYHHALVPESLRIRIEDAYRAGALRILVCTSTLTQGVNLPVKTVIVSHYRLGKDPISVRDFWNIAGRAGRANRETEGQVILIASTEGGPPARAIEKGYLEQKGIEPVVSSLARMFANVVAHRIPGGRLRTLAADAEIPDEPAAGEDEESGLAFESQILALVCEEVVGSEDQEEAERLLGSTLAAVQIRDRGCEVAPLVRWLRRRAAAVSTRVPDPELRQAFYRTGLSIPSCERLVALVDEYRQRLPEWIAEDRWDDARSGLLALAFESTESKLPEEVPAEVAVPMLEAWVRGASMEELRTDYADSAPALADPMWFNDFVQKYFVQLAPWTISSALLLLRHRLGTEDIPPQLSVLPALAKYGVSTAEAGFASAVGVARRGLAAALGGRFVESSEDHSFPSFLRWFAEQRLEDFRQVTGVDEPQARLLAERAARISPSRSAIDLLLGTVGEATMEVRGSQYEGRSEHLKSLAVGDELQLSAEPENPFDPNAVRVLSRDGQMLGYAPREFASGVAALLENGEALHVTCTAVDSAAPRLEIMLKRDGIGR